MSRLSSNVFAIGRVRGDENQLTALLGALFRRDPDALARFLESLGIDDLTSHDWDIDVELAHSRGRFDLVLSCTEAVVAVESKIHAGLGPSQVRRYLERLTDDTRPFKTLVVLAPSSPELVEEDRFHAQAQNIGLLGRRWQSLADCLGDPGLETLASDFVELLMSEDLAAPPALNADDWSALHGAPRAFARLVRLVTATADRLIASQAMATSTKARATGERRVIATLTKDDRQLRIGVAASDGWRRPDTPPMVWVGLSDISVPKERRRRWAEGRAAALIGEPDTRWVVRKQPAAALLSATSFDQQVDALVELAQGLIAADDALDIS
ncbi:MAG: hypothetical protein AB7H92_17940 [Microbacteriaceae bacterium]